LPDVICNTSPLQYLHQIGMLHLLPSLVGTVIVPEAVVEELAIGDRLMGYPCLTREPWSGSSCAVP